MRFGQAARLAILLCFATVAGAQEPDDSAAAPQRPFIYGLTGASFGFKDGRSEQALAAILGWHFTPNVSLTTTPTFARERLTGGTAVTTGFTDLPVELTLEHEVPGAPFLTAAFSGGGSLPTGGTASGFGAGVATYSISADLSASPFDAFTAHLGAGRSLSVFSYQAPLGFEGTWIEPGVTISPPGPLDFELGMDSELSRPDTGRRPVAISGGVAYSISPSLTINLSAARAMAGEQAGWSLALGFGSDMAWIGGLSVPPTRAARRIRQIKGKKK